MCSEKSLDDVIQVMTVFTNVSKGVLASSEELKKAFSTDDHRKCILEILNHGELQVSEKERKDVLEQTFKDIATIVAEKCVNPDTGRPYPPGMIERAMHDVHYSVNPNKTAKQQALVVIKLLQEKGSLKLERGKMRLLLVLPEGVLQQLKDKDLLATVESSSASSTAGAHQVQCLIDPSFFRDINDIVKKDGGSVEVLSANAAQDSQTE
jgi:ribosome maturation protein SDO1